ncbi:MAG: hypothetical protein EPN72_09405 [Nevskiaceae bacterium]|nr:MAG: hypothetical protein EPN63_08745 [Nevskiaceae bacterium]TBR72650.1 MAG: hypothetical protein EPN72_09405 [Nevskiaceae bacterium]
MKSTPGSTRRTFPSVVATTLIAAAALGASTAAQAMPSWWTDHVSLWGFVRGEVAMSTSNQTNPANFGGNDFSTYTVTRPTSNGLVPAYLQTTPYLKPGDHRKNTLFNYHILRGELSGNWRIGSDLNLRGHLIGIADPGNYNSFNWGDLNQVHQCVPGPGLTGTPANFPGGTGGCALQGGNPSLYGGAPNLFQYRVGDGKGRYDNHPVPLEWDSPNGQVFFQSLFLEYHPGPVNIRFGQQQIAWGNAIFFRVFDTANGLDLRRHSLFDYAQEEYQDKRVPAPALRVMWQANQILNVDAYVEKFQPTILGNPETSYSAIPSQFTVYDHYKDYETRLNTAIRLTAQFDQWSVEAMYGRRYNPWGAYSWTQSNVDRDYPNLPAGIGPLSAGTPFSSNPTGATSAYEWFNYAGRYRFDGTGALNTGINEFPASGMLGGVPVPNALGAFSELNAFHDLGNGLRGYLARKYFREDNIGLGFGYVTNTGATNSFLNQIVMHLEVRYTPNRTFTAPDASTQFLRSNDWVGAFILEKYYRFVEGAPSTYLVLQYMHRSRSDLFGRALAGYGAHDYVPVDPANCNAAALTTANIASNSGACAPRTDPNPHGISGANYVVFAAQQPFPNKIWQVALATLFDVHGGLLVQPAVQWTPSARWQATMFYNYVNGRLWGNPNNNLFGSTSQYANEVSVRLQYQF